MAGAKQARKPKDIRLGAFEHRFLSYLAMHGPMTMAELCDKYGTPNHLVRGTLVKAMDRLFKKGLVGRSAEGARFSYSAKCSAEDLQRSVIKEMFVDRLNGNIEALAAFLTEPGCLTKEERKKLLRVLKDVD